ncbi:tetratricopeptide repeat protein [Beggiatoa leptomitoformis]|uniref:tetratricopeptide repeat protein n=1 Tax=Beggiatoa leptomitoformis TaxID=288004 RepID=UPI000706BCF1|nr:tetratricopeptide repeat protein [Beggiatoa leptomitoformis]
MEYQSEQEQIEAIKQWFRENGSSILIGVAIGFGLLFGWRAWESYVAQTAEMSSMTYEQLVEAVEKKQLDSSRETLERLQKEHGDSLYAILGAFQIAAEEVEANNLTAAHERLQWILTQPTLPAFIHIARLRKAQLFVAENKLDDARKLIDGIAVGQFGAAYAELRGDIASLAGQLDAAKTAYTNALENQDLSPTIKQYIQIKLDNLGLSGEQVISAPFPTLPEPKLPDALQSDLGNPNTATKTSLEIKPATATPNTSTEAVLTIPASNTAVEVTPITKEEVKLPPMIQGQPNVESATGNAVTNTAQKRLTTPITNGNIYSSTFGDNADDDTNSSATPESATPTPTTQE